MVNVKQILAFGGAFAAGFIYGEVTAPPRTERRKHKQTGNQFTYALAWYYMNDDEFAEEFDRGDYVKVSRDRIAVIVAGLRMLHRIDHSNPTVTLDAVKERLAEGKHG